MNNKLILVIRKFCMMLILMSLALFLFNIAPYYKPKETFEKDIVRVVVDNKDVTNFLPDKVYIKDDIVCLSAKTIMKYTDAFVYYDEKYDTVIITSDVDVVKIKTGDNYMNVNGVNEELIGKVEIEKNETLNKNGEVIVNYKPYVPLNSLQEILNIKLDLNEKVILTTPEGGNRIHVVKADKKINLQLYKKELSKTIGEANKNENLYLFDVVKKQDSGESYVVARNERGDIGYVSLDKISKLTKEEYTEINKIEENKENVKYSLVWEYAFNFTPNRNNESKNEAIDIISPTWLHLNENLELKTTIDKSYINWAKTQGYQLWPTLKDDDVSIMKKSEFMKDMKLREKFIDEVTKCAVGNGFEGINIDFEYMYKEDADEFSQFVRELSANLRRNNLISSVDVTVPGGSERYSLCYDRGALADAVDYMMLMAYDQYGNSSASPGPTASLGWVEDNINTMLNYEGVPKEKLFLCVPFYYRTWLVDEDEEIIERRGVLYMSSAENYLQKYKNNVVWSEFEGQYYVQVPEGNSIRKIWIENQDSLKKKVELINKYDLAGVAAWRWGFEDNNAWKTIYETLEK